MKVAMTGSSGLIGKQLTHQLQSLGHEVVRFVRAAGTETLSAGCYRWDPEKASIDSNGLEGCDAVINLAGESIAAKRWTTEQKAKIRDSRLKSTNLLVNAIRDMKQPLKVLLSASAIGFYGDRGTEILTENSSAGNGFLADLCKDWEAAADRARSSSTRVVNGRIGVVLSKNGGALQKMLPIFQLGGGGNIGSGQQYMSWIALPDVVQAMIYALEHQDLSGPVNLVAPNPVTNAEFTSTLGQTLKRPAFVPLPAFAAKMIMGEMADELLLSGARIQPASLLASGYNFQYPKLDEALSEAVSD